ncbi:SET domain-containing protein [Marasmius fiardii PR-910]|nr:SET domain-containing protein [Marasmius fiardii PR-910]
MSSEPVNAFSLRTWLTEKNGTFDAKVRFQPVISGISVIATEEVAAETTIASCPFELAITKDTSKSSLFRVLKPSKAYALDLWNERQYIATYLCLHSIIDELEPSGSGHSAFLQHDPYVRMLPPAEKMRTGLHFTSDEREMFRGSNLFGAITDREKECREEWAQCAGVVTECNASWGVAFSWERYLTAATYISSRAFPSSLLSRNPSLIASSSTEPILLPGIDSINHARGKPVSWVVTYPDDDSSPASPMISLKIHYSVSAGDEILNNYGAKPNSELVLGYGFSISENPDDTILLKVGGGGADTKRWEVGRQARGADGLWAEILSLTVPENERATYEDHLDASAMLTDMVEHLIGRLPPLKNRSFDLNTVRPEVVKMYHDYIEGQRDILDSLVKFAEAKRQGAVEWAAAEGVELVFEE